MVGKLMSTSDKIMVVIVTVIVGILSVIFLYPFWETLVRSLSTPATANSLGLKLWPSEWTLDAYRFVFRDQSILVGFRNTVVRTLLGTAISVFVTFTGGYALSRKAYPGKTLITFYVVLTMFINAGIVPNYINIINLGMKDTFWALILPTAASAWNLTICRNFVGSLPYDLEESAMIDGAHPLRIVFQIVLPLSAPIIAVLSLWAAVGQWNAWFDAMVYTPNIQVMQLVVRRMIISSQDESNVLSAAQSAITNTTIKSATLMVCTIPIIIVYPFLQKYFVQGIMVGALKG